MTPALAFTVYLVLGVGLFGLFALGDRRIDEDTKRVIAGWLGRKAPADASEDGAPHDWAAAFLRWFDRVFGVREVNVPLVGRLYLPRLWRSILASFLALLVLSIVWFLHKETLSRQLRFESPSRHDFDELSILLIVYGSATLVTNWIPDYLSLIQSRWIMERMASAKSAGKRLGLLLVDALMTVAIAFGAIYIGLRLCLPLVEDRLTIEIGCFTTELLGFDDAWEIFVAGLRFESPPATLNYDASGIYIYSTFLTSLWVWIYLLVGLCMRAVVALRAPAAVARETLRDRRPLLSMGLVAVMAFSGLFWAVWLLDGARKVDVLVVADRAEVADPLVERLNAEGLRAKSFTLEQGDAEGGPEHLQTSLEEAELVVGVQEGFAPSPLVDAALVMRDQQEAKGERPKGSSLLEYADPEPNNFWLAHAVDWAKFAPSLLRRDQLKVCRERFPDRYQDRFGPPRRYDSLLPSAP